MAYEDDLIKRQIKDIALSDISMILEEMLKKINKLEQDVKELKNGGKKK